MFLLLHIVHLLVPHVHVHIQKTVAACIANISWICLAAKCGHKFCGFWGFQQQHTEWNRILPTIPCKTPFSEFAQLVLLAHIFTHLHKFEAQTPQLVALQDLLHMFQLLLPPPHISRYVCIFQNANPQQIRREKCKQKNLQQTFCIFSYLFSTIYMEIVFNCAMIIWFASFRCHYVTWNISDATICNMKYFRNFLLHCLCKIPIFAPSSFKFCTKFVHPCSSSKTPFMHVFHRI